VDTKELRQPVPAGLANRSETPQDLAIEVRVRA